MLIGAAEGDQDLSSKVAEVRFIGCDRAGARDYAAFLGFFFLEPS